MIPLPRLMVRTAHSEPSVDLEAWLLQAGLGGCPWRVAVASILLNRTTRRQVEPVLVELLERWPGPVELAMADRAELADCIRPLGLQYNRARTLIRFSAEFLEDGWDDLRDLPGVGPYVADAVGLVCFGCTDLESSDRALAAYADKLKRRQELELADLGGEAG